MFLKLIKDQDEAWGVKIDARFHAGYEMRSGALVTEPSGKKR